MQCYRAVCTLDRMNLSLLAPLGSDVVYFMVLKKRTDMTSAMEQHDVGCLKNTFQTTILKVVQVNILY